MKQITPKKLSRDESRAQLESSQAREHGARETNKGAAQKVAGQRPAIGRSVGAATKDNRHGLHTDRSTSRRTESRRDGHMGRESMDKSQRKNV